MYNNKYIKTATQTHPDTFTHNDKKNSISRRQTGLEIYKISYNHVVRHTEKKALFYIITYSIHVVEMILLFSHVHVTYALSIYHLEG